MGRPRIYNDRIQPRLRLTEDTYQWAQQQAARRGMSFTRYVELLIEADRRTDTPPSGPTGVADPFGPTEWSTK